MKQFMSILSLVVVLAFAGSVFGQVPTDGLIAYYPFNGNANDESGNGNDGIVYGNPELTTDRFGNPDSAYSFDGAGDYIRIPLLDSFPIDGEVTFSFWMNKTDMQSNGKKRCGFVFSQAGTAYIRVESEPEYRSALIATHAADYEVPSQEWIHYVVTVDSCFRTRIFRDGVFADEGLRSGPAIPSSDLFIGMHHKMRNNFYSGVLDDIMVFNRALTQEEAIQLSGNDVSPQEISSMVCVDSILMEKSEDQCTELSADASIPSTVKKLHINQNLKRDRGNLTVTMKFPLDYVIELENGKEVEVKIQLIQDGKIIELTGSKAMRKVGKSKHKLNYR